MISDEEKRAAWDAMVEVLADPAIHPYSIATEAVYDRVSMDGLVNTMVDTGVRVVTLTYMVGPEARQTVEVPRQSDDEATDPLAGMEIMSQTEEQLADLKAFVEGVLEGADFIRQQLVEAQEVIVQWWNDPDNPPPGAAKIAEQMRRRDK